MFHVDPVLYHSVLMPARRPRRCH